MCNFLLLHMFSFKKFFKKMRLWGQTFNYSFFLCHDPNFSFLADFFGSRNKVQPQMGGISTSKEPEKATEGCW